MEIRFYNFLSRKKEVFKPIRKESVNFYACGPTVYNLVHIGNLRTYVFEDVLRRVLKFNNYKVKEIMNITDVEDKIIKKAEQEKKDIYQITRPYTKLFLNDLKKLNIEKAEKYPLATKHIKEMVVLIKKMISKGFAYQGDDGSIYFNISKFKNYGKLSRLKKREFHAYRQAGKIGARVNADEYNKEQAQDFVLWKNRETDAKQNAKTREIKAYWQSPWGFGRPGWHIECSAMSMKYLGETFDIHCGAVDLIFPHHENEIAQSESATGKKFVNYWIEGEHLLIDGQKMSKSLGNIYPLEELEGRGFNPLAFRYLALTSHYRSKLNFTWESLQASANALNNLYQIYNSYKNDKKYKGDNNYKKYKKQFLDFINDDLNTPQAIALIWQIIKDNSLTDTTKKRTILEFDKVLGLGFNKIKPVKIPLKIKQMAEEREKLRTNKQFIPADLLRKQIEKLGYNIKDTPNGSEITPTGYRS